MMMLAEHLPQSNVAQTVIHDEGRQSESIPTNENSNSITPIKIPLVSYEPILATSSKYILVNEVTRRKKQFILYDEHLQKSNTRCFIKERMLDSLWYDKQQCFLILTSTEIYTFDPISKQTNLLNDIMPIENRTFKCFTLLNQSILLITYDQWSAGYLDKWQENENGQWILIQQQPLKLTFNEFIGDMAIINENDCTHLAITIYNDLTEEWRLELRYADTLICHKSILLPESNLAHDYRIISTKNAQPNIKLLIFSNGNPNIIAIDDQWKKRLLNYKHPVQRMALFNENYLIVRTTERVDIHLFF